MLATILPVAQWLERSTGVRKSMGLIPVGNSDFFFVTRSRHVQYSIFSYQPCFVFHLAQEFVLLLNQLWGGYVHYFHSKHFPSHASFCILFNCIFLIGHQGGCQASKGNLGAFDAHFLYESHPIKTVAELFVDPSASWTFFRSNKKPMSPCCSSEENPLLLAMPNS